jgi:3-hydroxyisobutyrate dehydrogenase-like beta-hydroxyacid dehydrogenase
VAQRPSIEASRPAAEQQESAEFVIRRVGVVGLGNMGNALAANLVEDGYQVLVFDTSRQRTMALLSIGAVPADRLGDLAGCDVVVTSLPNDDALAAVALGPEGLPAVLAAGAVHISTSTVSPAMSRRVSEEHARHQQDYVAAPVLGNPDFARARKLFVLAGGRPSALEKVRRLLERLGQRLFVISDDAAAANLMKLASNVLTATTLECMGEVLALVRKGGIDRHLAFDVLTNSMFDSRVHKTYGGKIIDERYGPPNFPAPLAMKDVRLALAEAERLAVPMPAASLAHDHLLAMVARGWADLDWSGLGLLAAVEAGLEDHL